MKQVLADILYTELIRSPNLSLLDEAIEEMAHPLFSDDCLEPLCLDGKMTFDTVWKRFRDCATGLADVPTQQRDQNIRNCLLALSGFIRLYETRFRGPYCNPQFKESSLRKALSVDSPLHRWNALAADLRPLAFSVRAHISVLLAPSSESDFRKEELEEQPWGMALKDICHGYRYRFILGACRGVVQSQHSPNLRTVSSLTLCLSLAKGGALFGIPVAHCSPSYMPAALTSSNSALMTEWTGIHDGKDSTDAKRHVSRVMDKLYGIIGEHTLSTSPELWV